MKILKISNNHLDSSVFASHIHITDRGIKEQLASDMFAFMNDAYKYIGGFRSFTGEDDFIDNSYLWYITYDGEAPKSISQLDMTKVYTVSVFKQKYGLKLVGIGNNRFNDMEPELRKGLKDKAASALRQHIGFIVRHGWAEVSGNMEKLFRQNVSSRYIIDPEDLYEAGVFHDIEIWPDNLHYSRKLSTGLEVDKIAYGTIQL